MTDIRRTILWVVFTMSLVLLWDAWNKHNGQPTMFGARLPTPAATGAGAAAGVPGALPGAVGGVPASGAVAAAAGVPGVAAALPTGTASAPASELVTLTTDVLKARFDSVGGSLVHLEMLNYKDTTGAVSRNVVLFDQSPKRVYLAQTGLVPATGTDALPNHLTPMSVAPGPRELVAGTDTLTLRFESVPVEGRKLAKTYTFKRGQYTVAVQHEFTNGGSTPVQPKLYLQLARDGSAPEGESSMYFTFTGPAIYTEAAKFQKLDFKDIAKGSATFEKTAKDGWVGMVQHYFASAWLLKPGAEREFKVAKINPPGLPETYTVAMVTPLGEAAPGATLTHESTLFAGPQEENKLAALSPGLELVKDYGWLTMLAKPLFWLLDKLHSVLGNWGWSIVALVFLLKIAFYSLNASAYKSMAKMKAVGPRVAEMRERMKDKPQEMQQEMMRIYREEKVNPIGGCLPIFVQMPFFIALYWVLLSSVEMRNAPWIGWITDLAAPDTLFGTIPGLNVPIGLLPILMTASSLFQVWLNPAPADPMQAKMMWIMPLVFGVMFFVFPAGLVLYWLTNNILSIAQQWYINRSLGVNK
jgi:YidC/Oxa1 family membrane protein insertase